MTEHRCSKRAGTTGGKKKATIESVRVKKRPWCRGCANKYLEIWNQKDDAFGDRIALDNVKLCLITDELRGIAGRLVKRLNEVAAVEGVGYDCLDVGDTGYRWVCVEGEDKAPVSEKIAHAVNHLREFDRYALTVAMALPLGVKDATARQRRRRKGGAA